MLMLAKTAMMRSGGDAVVPSLVSFEWDTDSADPDVNKPAGTLEGHLLLGIMSRSLTSGTNWAPPAGWTTDIAENNQGLAHKIAGASEPSVYEFDSSTTTGTGNTAIILTLEDGVTITVGTMYSANLGAGASFDIPEIVMPARGILIAVMAATTAGRTFTTPAGMTDIVALTSNAAIKVCQQLVGAGPQGPKTSTINASAGARGYLIGITGP